MTYDDRRRTGHITPDPKDRRQVAAVAEVLVSGADSPRALARLALAALRDLPPEPPQPPEPQEPGTIRWDHAGQSWRRAKSSWETWVDGAPHFEDWPDLVARYGPLTTTPPGTIPAAAVDDDLALSIALYVNDRTPLAITVEEVRAVLARIRDWQPT